MKEYFSEGVGRTSTRALQIHVKHVVISFIFARHGKGSPRIPGGVP